MPDVYDCIICVCTDGISSPGASSLTLQYCQRLGVEAVHRSLCDGHRRAHDKARAINASLIDETIEATKVRDA